MRYQRDHPDELLHFDIVKLGRIVRPSHHVTGDRRDQTRGAGWEYAHVAIDDAFRIAFAQILPDERKGSALTFLATPVRRKSSHLSRILSLPNHAFKLPIHSLRRGVREIPANTR